MIFYPSTHLLTRRKGAVIYQLNVKNIYAWIRNRYDLEE